MSQTTEQKPRRPNGLVLRGSAEWREWLKRLARADRSTVAELLDRAAAEYAKSKGFTEPPPPR